MLDREEYLAAWSRWHGGADTQAPLVRGWLTLAHTLARPLAVLPPVAATAAGVLVAAAAVPPAAAGGGWLIVAGLLVGLSGLLDSLDGALAIGTGRASQRGFVLDSVVDRLTEAAYAAALWAAGAPGWLAVSFGALCWLPDYLRARAGQAGVHRTGPISLWERPTRVAMSGLTLGGAGVVSGLEVAGFAGGPLVVTAGAAVGVALGAVGTVQLGWWLRGELSGPGQGTVPGPG
ncbi:CDP-alcohol phosphatidyltransferase family protein [Blastococcus xanthinilyticus]|uniref:CDP-diacylglycerol--glycerol-3-phosphate 3-phosphatidyltransferase n=1 Tax=Blastococcus xanthinilyticus TaxID=1564164 RepID=A0A5S5CZA4_9ACTN|nr:CDP-alcohol phosphatidyltransferase family protein [Blastococcus xanthinilyticus]TYP88348.1 CDP-diacylglycerol--glycerol-3-phosphate 3-phosphatidyltransferase [Blastococcus xanthinilyticus]